MTLESQLQHGDQSSPHLTTLLNTARRPDTGAVPAQGGRPHLYFANLLPWNTMSM